jgi:3-isopropylmalate dehydrogenase
MHATITTLPGDGFCPDVVAQGVAVLHRVAAVFGHTFTINTALLGGCAIDATGTALPEATLIACQASDAVLPWCRSACQMGQSCCQSTP